MAGDGDEIKIKNIDSTLQEQEELARQEREKEQIESWENKNLLNNSTNHEINNENNNTENARESRSGCPPAFNAFTNAS